MSRIKVTRQSGQLEISYRWRTAASWFLIIWAVIWNVFVLGFLIFAGEWFVLIHAIVGVIVGYFALAVFFNTSRIVIDRSKMSVTHGPIPWPFSKDQEIPARALVQLYVDKSNVKVNKKPTYNLVAKLDTGATVKLLKSEPDRELVLQLERTIEAYLDIKNDESFDLSASGHTTLDLKQLQQQMEMLEPIKKWLPKPILAKMEEAQARIEREATQKGLGKTPPSESPWSAPPTSSPREDDWDVKVKFPKTTARPFPEPEHDFGYALYRAAEGSLFTWNVDPHRIGRTAQLDWDDGNDSIGRQMEVQATLTGDKRYLYAEAELGRWSYFEERRLDDDEVALLGFEANSHPHRFENGQDRYYPRNEQKGRRYVGSSEQSVRQFIYFTTASSTQFRALQLVGGTWEVYVMEPVDGSSFDKA